MPYSSDDEESDCGLHGLFDELDSARWRLMENSQGSFAFKRTHTNAPNPTLRIEGLGRVGLPLGDEAAKAVTARCEHTDEKDVRGAWEMVGTKVVSDNQEWQGFIHGAMGDVCEALGVNQGLSKPRLDLYKLVVHEPMAHGLPPINTDMPGNVFATVVFILPTEFTGGDVHASHGSRSMVVNTSQDSLTKTTVLAWYTGVTYELKPITSGVRLALVYNLVHTTAAPPPVLRDTSEAMQQLCDVMRRWNSGLEDAPDRLIIELEDEYSKKKTLTARALKGHDARSVAVIDEAAKSVGLGMGLAVFRHSVSRLVRRTYEGAYVEVDDEVTDDSTIGNLADLEGRLLRAEEMQFEDKKNINPPCFLDDLIYEGPDTEDFDDSDYGRGDLTQTYSKHVLVLWPTWGELAKLPGDRRAQEALSRLRTFEGQAPTPEIEQAFAYVAQSTMKDSLRDLCDLARKWERADLWSSAILAFGDENCTVEMVAGLEKFGFEALKSTIGEFVRTRSSNAARFYVLERVRAWSLEKDTNAPAHLAVDAFLQAETHWLLQHITAPSKLDMKLLTNEAIGLGGPKIVDTILVPHVRAFGDIGFMRDYATFLMREVAQSTTRPEEVAALERATDALLCDVADKFDFFPNPEPPAYTYVHRPPPSHKPAFAFLKECIDVGKAAIAARALSRMLDDVARASPEEASSHGRAILLPLIRSLKDHIDLQSQSSALLPLDELASTTIGLICKSDVARRCGLTAEDLDALVDATTVGTPRMLLERLVHELEGLPWREDFALLCINTIRARRREHAFASISAHVDSLLSGMTQAYAHRVDYLVYDGAKLHALFTLCVDAGGLDCLSIFLDRAIDAKLIEPAYVEKTLVPMIGPFTRVARDFQLQLSSDPFAHILHTIICIWVNTCLVPRPDEQRVLAHLATLSQYTCACVDCTPVRKYLNRHGARTGGRGDDACYLTGIGSRREDHVVREVHRWAKDIADIYRPYSGYNMDICIKLNDVLPSLRRWKKAHARSIQTLENNINPTELAGIFGAQYPALVAAIRPFPA